MIPEGRYSPRRVKSLQEFLTEELRQARHARREKEEAWVAFHEAYHAQPFEKEKKFPFRGASNLVIPLIATDVDTMFSRLMGMLFEPENLFSMQALNPEMEPFAPRIQEFMKWAQHNEIDFTTPVGDWMLEILKLGTGVLKQRYHREVKKVFEWRELEQGTWEQQMLTLLKDAPRVDRTPLYNFFVPPGFRDLKDAPWCGEEIYLTWGRFLNRVQAGIYQGGDRITEWSANSRGSWMEQQLQQISGYAPSLGKNLKLVEFWTDFDIDEDGWEEAIVCTIHEDSASIVRLDFNPFFNQDKPYSVARFMRDENSFYGKGLAEMLDPFQEEITAQHNQRIDNGTISNSQMFAVRKDNNHISVDEPVYPSKIWFLNDPANDIRPINMGNGSANAASIQNEQFSLQYSQRRTGINDYVYGQSSPEIGYSTAYTTQQMMLNSTRRQGEVLREIRNALGETGTRVLELYQQFNQRGKEFFAVGLQDGQMVRAILQFPIDLIRRGIRVSVTAIDVATSKDAQIRTTTLIMQQLLQFYQQIFQGMGMAVNPQVPPPLQQMAVQMVQGATFLMRRLLDQSGEQNIDKILPDLEGGMNAYQRQLSELQNLISLGGGQGGVGAPPPNQGMAALPPVSPAGLLGNPQPSSQFIGYGGGVPSPGGVGSPGTPF